MKMKMKMKINGLLCLILAMVLSTSCSDNAKMKGLLEHVPAGMDVVLVGNVKTIVESAGGTMEDSKIQLPKFIMNALPDDASEGMDKCNRFLKKSGVDIDACAMVVNYKENHPVFVFALNDRDKFVEAIEDEGFKEKSSEGDFVIYSAKVSEGSDPDYDDYAYIAVDGSCAYWIDNVWVGSDFKPVPYLEQLIDDAKENSYANTSCGAYIVEGNAGGLAVTFPKDVEKELKVRGMPSELASLYSGSVCMRGNLTNNQCTLEVKLFDQDGQEISAEKYSKLMDTSATISEKALSLLGSDEFMIYAMSLKNFNWDNYADMMAEAAGMGRSDRAQLNAVMSYFEKVDGTVAWGFGLTKGIESIENFYCNKEPMNQFSSTLVVEVKEGKAKQMIEDLKGFMEKAELPFEETSNGLTFNFENIGESGSLYIKNIDKFIVMANHPIKEDNDNPLVKSTDFVNYLSVFCISLPKDNKLMRDLRVKNDVKLGLYCKPNTMETSMTLDIDGDDETGVIAKAAKIVINMVEQSEDIARRMEKMRWQEDDLAVDTCVVDETVYVDSIAY